MQEYAQSKDYGMSDQNPPLALALVFGRPSPLQLTQHQVWDAVCIPHSRDAAVVVHIECDTEHVPRREGGLIITVCGALEGAVADSARVANVNAVAIQDLLQLVLYWPNQPANQQVRHR